MTPTSAVADADFNAAQVRVLQTLMLLRGHEFTGLAPSEIYKALKTTPSNTTRDLRVLQHLGLAEAIPETGRWRLGPQIVQIAIAFQLELDRHRRRVDEVGQRYTRTPN